MQEGEAKLAAMAAFVADPFLKFVVVVDHDVDINSDTDVLHAIATRVRADTDTFMVPYAKGSPLDPASYDPAGGSNLVTKMGIDATRKANYPDEISVPGFQSIDMAAFIPGYRSSLAPDRQARPVAARRSQFFSGTGPQTSVSTSRATTIEAESSLVGINFQL